jgi:hypothetical protein
MAASGKGIYAYSASRPEVRSERPLLCNGLRTTMNTIVQLCVLTLPLLVGTSCRRSHLEASAVPRTGSVASPSNRWGVETGATLTECRERIPWSEVDIKTITDKEPFYRTLSFLPQERTVVWAEDAVTRTEWPNFLIGVFSSRDRGYLVDLFYVVRGVHHPIVAGDYERTLRKVSPGWKVTDIYRYLGRQLGDYFQDENGRWRIRYTYNGFRGTFIMIEADAASGIVTSAQDGTL